MLSKLLLFAAVAIPAPLWAQAKICQEDKEKFCAGTTGSAAEQCMIKNIDNWSDKCKAEYKAAMDQRQMSKEKRSQIQAQIDEAKAKANSAMDKYNRDMAAKNPGTPSSSSGKQSFAKSPCAKEKLALREKHLKELMELGEAQKKQRDAETDSFKKAQLGKGHIEEQKKLEKQQKEELKKIASCK